MVANKAGTFQCTACETTRPGHKDKVSKIETGSSSTDTKSSNGKTGLHWELCALSNNNNHDNACLLALINFCGFALGTIFSDDHAIHLYCNFVDKHSLPMLVRGSDQCATRVSWREVDVLTSVKCVKDAAELLSYCNTQMLEAMAAVVPRRCNNGGLYAQRACHNLTTLLMLQQQRRRGMPNGTLQHR